MKNRIVRFLVFACSLILVLPEGWCCMFASQTPDTGKTAPAKSGGCCDCCTGDAPTTSAPTEKPAPAPERNCPCSERHATLSSSTLVKQVDAAFVPVAMLTSFDSVPVVVSVIGEVVSVFHPPTRQIHVSKCVWLC